MGIRLIYLLILCLFAFWVPGWLLILGALLGLFRLPNFYEIVLPAFIFDVVRAAPGVTPVAFPFMLTVFSLALVYLVRELKGYLNII